STIQKQYEVSTATLRRWDEEKKIETIRAPGGKRLYNSEQIDKLFQRVEQSTKVRKKVCYARVSSDLQRGDLKRQIEDLRKAYPDHETIPDVGSGINYQRRNIKRLLDRAFNRDIEEIVITHKDRLCRFGYDLIEYMLDKLDVKIKLMVSSQSTDAAGRDDTQELSEDLLSMVTVVFVARHHGKRSAENRRRRKRERTSQEEVKSKRKA